MAARARHLPPRGAPRRRRVLPDAVPGGTVDGAPARARSRSSSRRYSLPWSGGVSSSRRACLAAIPLSGQLHLALGAVPLALGYAWARTSAGRLVESGRRRRRGPRRGPARRSVGGRGLHRHRPLLLPGRPATRPSSRTSSRRGGRKRHRGARLPRLADARSSRSAGSSRSAAAPGWPSCSGSRRCARAFSPWARNLPGYETALAASCRASTRRVCPERFMPIACLALAALVAFAFDAGGTRARVESTQARPTARRRGRRRPARGRPAGAGVRRGRGRHAERGVRGDPGGRPPARAAGLPPRRPLRERLPRLRATEPARAAAGVLDDRAEARGPARARASPAVLRSRRRSRATSAIRFVAVHRALYAQSGFFAPGCAARAEHALVANGWRRLAGDGTITVFTR